MRKIHREQCSPLINDYLTYMEIVKGRSIGTVEEYFFDLRTFFRFMKKHKNVIPEETEDEEIDLTDIEIDFIKTISTGDIYQYMIYMKNEKNNSSKTLARKASSLRGFFSYYVVNTKLLSSNPVETLETPKFKKTLPKYLSLEECIELLQMPSGAFALRDYCMLVLMLNCGLRRAELAGLNVNDIRSDNTMRVLGKGNKERALYLNEACIDAVARYLPTRPIDGVEKSERNALFYSTRKKRISLRGVNYIIDGYLNKLDHPEGLSPHKLRHTAATLMYRNGVDVRALQDVLGHESLNTTQIYTHVSSDSMKAAAKANPLANIKIAGSNKKSFEKVDGKSN